MTGFKLRESLPRSLALAATSSSNNLSGKQQGHDCSGRIFRGTAMTTAEHRFTLRLSSCWSLGELR